MSEYPQITDFDIWQSIGVQRWRARMAEHKDKGCPTCNGNGSEMACSYPGENKPGCLHTYITIGRYTLSVVNNKTVSIFMDDGEGGTFRLHDFEATIAEFYRDNYS